MKRKLGRLLLAMGVALGLMAFRKQAAPPDLSSPKAAVRSFFNAMKNQDVAAMQKCVKGSADQAPVKQMFEMGPRLPLDTIVNLVEEKEGDAVHVAAEFSLKIPGTAPAAKPSVLTLVDMFTLIKQGDSWLLAPAPGLAEAPTDAMALAQLRPVSFAVAILATPEIAKVFDSARNKARAVACTSNVKQITTAVMMYMQDYDEFTPRKNASYVDQVYPYIKNRQVFTCPLDANGTISYTFNSGVAGIPLSAVAAPAQTVMVYEGKAGKLDYKHDGKAVVGFMDGHVKQIGPDEANALIWAVKYSPPPAKPAKKKKK